MPCQSPHQGQRNKERNTVERQEPVKRERRYRGTGGGARPTGDAVEGEVLEAEAEAEVEAAEPRMRKTPYYLQHALP